MTTSSIEDGDYHHHQHWGCQWQGPATTTTPTTPTTLTTTATTTTMHTTMTSSPNVCTCNAVTNTLHTYARLHFYFIPLSFFHCTNYLLFSSLAPPRTHDDMHTHGNGHQDPMPRPSTIQWPAPPTCAHARWVFFLFFFSVLTIYLPAYTYARWHAYTWRWSPRPYAMTSTPNLCTREAGFFTLLFCYTN